MTDNAFEDLERGGSGIKIRRRRWTRLAAIWGIWTVIGLVFTLQGYFTSYRSERPIPFTEALYMQMVWAYLFALATPLVLWASARLPIEKSNWIRSVLLHLPISIVLSIALTALGRVLMWLKFSYPAGRALTFESVTRFVIGNFSEAMAFTC